MSRSSFVSTTKEKKNPFDSELGSLTDEDRGEKVLIVTEFAVLVKSLAVIHLLETHARYVNINSFTIFGTSIVSQEVHFLTRANRSPLGEIDERCREVIDKNSLMPGGSNKLINYAN